MGGGSSRDSTSSMVLCRYKRVEPREGGRGGITEEIKSGGPELIGGRGMSARFEVGTAIMWGCSGAQC